VWQIAEQRYQARLIWRARFAKDAAQQKPRGVLQNTAPFGERR
jgi:hypothetical protein